LEFEHARQDSERLMLERDQASRQVRMLTNQVATRGTDTREAESRRVTGDAMRIRQETLYYTRLRLLVQQTILGRYDAALADPDAVEVARLRLRTEEQRIRFSEARARRLDDLLEEAFAARIDRAKQEQQTWSRRETTGAEWARPYFHERATLGRL